MRMVDIIEKKRNNVELTKQEIDFVIDGYSSGEIPDYQMSAFAMAVYFNSMNDKESTNLAMAMLKSGDEIDLSSIDGIKVDKHSTGGVGDKTTLVLAPLVASCGVPVAKMSGRGLGHTGGTLDKLESIPGFNISVNTNDFINQVNSKKIAVIGQTANLTPADKKLYALRDVTATVDSIPLIASSIMSKKLASGADAIVLDVKVGSGAFMKNIDDARKLAKLMVSIGNNLGRKTTAYLTSMEQPLGNTIGNSLEVKEAVETLKGKGPTDLTELCYKLASQMIISGGIVNDEESALKLIKTKISNGEALNKLIELIASQSGDKTYIEDPEKFEKAKEVVEVKSIQDGYVTHIEALEVGIAAMLLGAGRETKEDKIDMAVGIVLNKKIGDKVKNGEVLAYLHTNGRNTKEAVKKVFDSYSVSDKITENKLILDIIK